jgi:hypothetical protein
MKSKTLLAIPIIAGALTVTGNQAVQTWYPGRQATTRKRCQLRVRLPHERESKRLRFHG